MTKNDKNGARAYIYTRVSTIMQVDGFSLEAQKKRIEEYATYQHMKVVGVYSDEGTSGKNIEGRPQFQQMLDDIKNSKDNVKFVLVFKLSRFGRNAADTLSSLQMMQDYGVNLICVDDNIDSSADSGKLMISVMSAMAEIERENILAQTMAGRKQKALNGGWNGGFAPYGYKLDNGQLVIAEDEAETVRYIFELYTSCPLGANGVAKRLNAEGIKKTVRQNGTLDTFTGHFIKLVLDNPVYMGKIAFGRRKTEKVTGKRNVYHIVKETDMENIIISDGEHEAIVSEEVWNDAHDKRLRTGFKKEKKEQDHEYVLSGIVLCPGCGKPMYGVASRKKRKDGTPYPPSYAYICRQKGHATGYECSFRKQFNCREIDDEVANAISFCFVTPEIVDQVYALISKEFDTSELQQRLDGYKAREKELKAKQSHYEKAQGNLDPFDKHYDRKFSNYEKQLEDVYDKLDEIEGLIQDVEGMIENTTATQKSRENTVRLLMEYGQRYRYLSLAEQKKLANLLIESIEVFPTKRAMGYLKTIHFSVPVVSGGEIKKTMSIWDEYPDILDEEGNFNGYNPEDDLPPSGGFEADEDGNVVVQDENAFLPKKITDETINQRGKGLDPMDLLKNMVFRQVDRSKFKELNMNWKAITTALEQIDEKPLRFLRYFIMANYDTSESKDGIIREEQIYSWLSANKSQCRYEEEPFKFVQKMKDNVDIYVKCRQPENNLNGNIHLKNIPMLAGKSYKLHLMLMLAASNMDEEANELFKKTIESVVYYTVIDKVATNVTERTFVLWCRRIRQIKTIEELQSFINEIIVPTVNEWKQDNEINFLRLGLNSMQQYRIKFILGKITAYVDSLRLGKDTVDSLEAYIPSAVEIEHIMPQTCPDMSAYDITEEEFNVYINRLGNLTLLENTLNKSIHNDKYDEKLIAYKQSKFYLTSAISELVNQGQNTAITRTNDILSSWSLWTKQSIEERQRMLYDLSERIWAINDNKTE